MSETAAIHENVLNDHYPHPILAREGWLFIAIAVVLALAITLFFGGWIALPLWLLAAFVIQFFRDPARDIPDEADAILAPADGRVIKVEQAHDEHAGRDALKISIFMNVFNVHSNRAPVDARVVKANYFAGKFFNADLDKASEANERNALVLERQDGQIITCVQVAGLIARRILCYVTINDNLRRGSRFGFIRFGSRVDVFLPLHAEPKVTLGQKVSASSTIIAQLAQSEGGAAAKQ